MSILADQMCFNGELLSINVSFLEAEFLIKENASIILSLERASMSFYFSLSKQGILLGDCICWSMCFSIGTD